MCDYILLVPDDNSIQVSLKDEIPEILSKEFKTNPVKIKLSFIYGLRHSLFYNGVDVPVDSWGNCLLGRNNEEYMDYIDYDPDIKEIDSIREYLKTNNQSAICLKCNNNNFLSSLLSKILIKGNKNFLILNGLKILKFIYVSSRIKNTGILGEPDLNNFDNSFKTKEEIIREKESYKEKINKIRNVLGSKPESKPETIREPETNGYIYITRRADHVNTCNNVYKIGKTRQKISMKLNRFKGYPKGSEIILLLKTDFEDEIESKILKKIKEKNITPVAGRETFNIDENIIVNLVIEEYKNFNN